MLNKKHRILFLHGLVVRVLLTSLKRNHYRNGIIRDRYFEQILQKLSL